MIKKLHTAGQVRQMSFPGLALPEPFKGLLGEFEPTTSLFVWGLPGGGKTTFALDLLAAVADVHGPALFVAGEQAGASKQVQEKLHRLKISGDTVLITDFSGFEALKKAVENLDIKAVLLDSTTALDNARATGTLDFRKWAEERGIVFIYIAHAYKAKDTYKGVSELAHLAKVVVCCFEDEVGTKIVEVTKNRMAPTPSSMAIRMKITGPREKKRALATKKKRKEKKPSYRHGRKKVERLLIDSGLTNVHALLDRATK